MEYRYLLVCVLVFRASIIVQGEGNTSIEDVVHKLNDMGASLLIVEASLVHVKQELVIDLEDAKRELNAHVTNTIIPTAVRRHVERALEDILLTRSVDSLINSHVMNKLERFEKDKHQMKTHSRIQSCRLNAMQRDNRNIRRGLHKVQHDLMTTQTVNEFQALEITRLTLELNETRKQDGDSVAAVGSTSDSLNSTVLPNAKHLEDNYSRILVVSDVYPSVPKQVSLKNGSVQTFPLKVSDVGFTGVVFVQSSRNIIFSVTGKWSSNPSICSSNLAGSDVKFIKRGVLSSGFAVDESMDVIFMAVRSPRRGVYRIRPDGSEFRVVRELEEQAHIFKIAVVPDKQRIYTSHRYAVIETSYDGTVKRTITKTVGSYALVYDTISDTLFYNANKMVMRWSPKTNQHFEMYRVQGWPFSFVFDPHSTTIYIGYFDKGRNEVGVLDLSKEEYMYQSFNGVEGTFMSLCLIP